MVAMSGPAATDRTAEVLRLGLVEGLLSVLPAISAALALRLWVRFARRGSPARWTMASADSTSRSIASHPTIAAPVRRETTTV